MAETILSGESIRRRFSAGGDEARRRGMPARGNGKGTRFYERSENIKTGVIIRTLISGAVGLIFSICLWVDIQNAWVQKTMWLPQRRSSVLTAHKKPLFKLTAIHRGSYTEFQP